jgi:hypothetical protein
MVPHHGRKVLINYLTQKQKLSALQEGKMFVILIFLPDAEIYDPELAQSAWYFACQLTERRFRAAFVDLG